MIYYKTFWKHDDPKEPNWFYSEVDSDGIETRRLEVFLNGQYAYYDERTPDRLAEFPSEEDIQASGVEEEVHMSEISKEEFEKLLLYYDMRH